MGISHVMLGQMPLQIVSGGGSGIVSKPVNKPNKPASKFERYSYTFTSTMPSYHSNSNFGDQLVSTCGWSARL